MKDLDKLNPIVCFLYFVLLSAICMFSSNPIIALIALIGSVLNFLLISKKIRLKGELGFFALFLFMIIINPIFVRKGTTVLLVVNDNPITLEAVVYGAFSSAIVISVIYIFRLFSCLMTEDKLLYIFGSAFPKLSLILSGALRYTSLLSERRKKIETAQKAAGIYKDGDVFEKTKSSLRVFSALVTWSLENSVITADSMSARGYGVGRRTFFSLFGFSRSDLVFSLCAFSLGMFVIVGELFFLPGFSYYPTLKTPVVNELAAAVYIAYAILMVLPIICKISEDVKWKFLKSKI